MNNNFLVHIVRDVFGSKKSPIVYGRDTNLVEQMRSSVHGMGAVLFHSDFPIIRSSDSYYLNIDDDHLGHYVNYADFMLSLNYQYVIDPPFCDRVAKKFLQVMKHESQILLINPGTWSFCFDDFYDRNLSLEREVKRFSMLSSEKVFVYENI